VAGVVGRRTFAAGGGKRKGSKGGVAAAPVSLLTKEVKFSVMF